jgi:hypothetical protein
MKRLKNVSPERVFYVHEGGTIKNLYELAENLASMKQSSFSHHVSQFRNDFANWVRDVVDDSILAMRLSLQRDRKQMEKNVRQRIKELEQEHLPAHASKSFLRTGIIDFVVGMVIGIVAGLILASFI